MTQTGGLVILLAWAIFGILLAILAYVLLRAEKDPLQDLSTVTVDHPDAPSGTADLGGSQPGQAPGENGGRVAGR
jgi:hypothetical protein